MTKFIQLLGCIAIFLTFAISAQAQSTVSSKSLCDPAFTPLLPAQCTPIAGTAPFGQSMTYEFTVIPNPAATSLQLVENIPASFTPMSGNALTCTASDGSAVAATMTAPPGPLTLDFSGLTGLDFTCRLSGVFDDPGALVLNEITDPATGQVLAQTTHSVSPLPYFDADIVVQKSVHSLAPQTTSGALDLSVNGTGILTYAIEITTDFDVTIGSHFKLSDQMGRGAGAILLDALISGQPSCDLNGTPVPCGYDQTFPDALVPLSGLNDLASIEFTGPPVLLRPSDRLRVLVDVEITLPDPTPCIIQDPQIVLNQAFLTLANGSFAINDADFSNNTSAVVTADVFTGVTNIDPNCNGGGGIATPTVTPQSPLAISKSLVPPSVGTQSWGNDIFYEIVLQNTDPQHPILNISLSDIVQNLPFTPNFDVEVLSLQIVTCPGPVGNCGSVTMPTQQIQHYTDQALMGNVTIAELQPGEQVVIRIRLRPFNVGCDAAPNAQQKFFDNVAVAAHQFIDPITGDLENGVVASAARVKMEGHEPCEIKVIKEQIGGPNRIIFGQQMEYEVRFQNLHDVPMSFGTLVDAVRIVVPGYSGALPVAYDFDCGGVDVTDYTPSGQGSGFTTHVTQSNAALRIMDHPGFVTFGPNTELTCHVRLTVSQPAASDPFCFSTLDIVPEFENAAFMDQSLFYNSNLPFPQSSQGHTWDIVRHELPRCYDVSVNKSAVPAITGPQGPDARFDITVVNNADNSGVYGNMAFTTPDSGIFLDDALVPSTPEPQTHSFGCWPVNGCSWPLQVPPFRALVPAIPNLSGTIANFMVTPAPEFEPDQICNDVEGVFLINGAPPDPTRWYERQPHPSKMVSRACLQIRNTVRVTKMVDGVTPMSGSSFNVTVSCERDGTTFPSETLTLSAANNWTASAQRYVYVGSTCTVTEVPPLPTIWPHCTWNAPGYVPAQQITTDPSKNIWDVELTNTATCLFGDLNVVKLVNPAGFTPDPGQVVETPPAGTTFDITVTCTDGVNPDVVTTVTLPAGGGTEQILDIPASMTCTATEAINGPVDPECSWVQGIQSQGTAITNGVARNITPTLQVTNHYVCTPQPKFEVIKTLHPDSHAIPQGVNPVFPITISNCAGGTPDIASFSFAHPADFTPDARQTVVMTGTTAGQPATCEVREQFTAIGGGNCKWERPRYSRDGGNTWVNGFVTVQADIAEDADGSPSAEVLVENRLYCPGEISVEKTCAPMDLSASPFALECTLSVTSSGDLPVPGWFHFFDAFGQMAPSFGAVPGASLSWTSSLPGLTCSELVPGQFLLCNGSNGDLVAAGGTATVDVTVTIPDDTAAETLFNCALGEDIGTGPYPFAGVARNSFGVPTSSSAFGDNTSCVTVDLPPLVDVRVTKRVNRLPAAPGYTVTPPPPTNITVLTTCSGVGAPVTLPLGVGTTGGSTIVGQARVGATCTATETLSPQAQSPCRWREVTQPITVSQAGPNELIYDNVYECAPTGEIDLIKSVNPPSPFPPWALPYQPRPVPAGTSYMIDVTCTDPQGVQTQITVPFGPAGGVENLSNLVAGSVCTASEQPLTNAAKDCRWRHVLTPSGGVTVPASGVATLTMTNVYECRRRNTAFLLAPFDVVKLIDPASAPIPPGVDFPIQISNCTGQGQASVSAHNFAYPGGFSGSPQSSRVRVWVTSQSSGAACEVRENAPTGPALPAGCGFAAPEYSTDSGASWSPTPPMVQGGGLNATTEVWIVNRVDCKPSLAIKKSCMPNPLQVVGPGPAQMICEISVDGQNLPSGQALLIEDQVTGVANGAPVPLVANSVSSSNPDMPCGAGNNTGSIICAVQSNLLNQQGGMSTQVTMSVQNASAHEALENCVTIRTTGFKSKLSAGPACDKIEVVTPKLPRFEAEKVCDPNPLVMTGPGPATIVCKITVAGQNLQPGQNVLLDDVITDLGGNPVVSVLNVDSQGDFGCQLVTSYPAAIECGFRTDDMIANGGVLSTEVEMLIENAWDLDGLRNCIEGSGPGGAVPHSGGGGAAARSSGNCAEIEVVQKP